MLLGAKTRLWFIDNSELSISGLKTLVCIYEDDGFNNNNNTGFLLKMGFLLIMGFE